MASTTELDVLKSVTENLESESFDYMLTGSMAMNYYAQPRMTRNIDIVVALNVADASRVLGLFEQDYYISGEAVSAALDNVTMFNLLHLESVVKVDVIVRKPDEYRLLEFDRRRPVKLAEYDVCIVSKEDLILSKLSWRKETESEMQLRDVRNLLGTGADETYLRRWAPTLGVDAALERCLNG